MRYVGKPPQRPGSWGNTPRSPAQPVSTAPLGEERYKALLAQANAFFAASEPDFEARKAEAIAEILALMAQHRLTIEDLGD